MSKLEVGGVITSDKQFIPYRCRVKWFDRFLCQEKKGVWPVEDVNSVDMEKLAAEIKGEFQIENNGKVILEVLSVELLPQEGLRVVISENGFGCEPIFGEPKPASAWYWTEAKQSDNRSFIGVG